MEKIKKTKVKVKCTKCSHKWETKSKFIFISCPNCQNKIKRIDATKNALLVL